MKRFTLITSAIMSCLAVAMGAFGAHALEEFLLAQQRLETYQTAVQYQFYHSLGMFGVGVYMQKYPPLKWLNYSSISFFVGMLFFSGSLYVLCFTGLGILGAITPIGGLLFIAAWIFIVVAVLKVEDK